VAAFRATLEEVLEADLIVHVRDIAHPETEEQARDVRKILHDLGVAQETPVLELWNKADMLPEAEATALANRAARDDSVWLGSAVTGQGLEAFFAALSAYLDDVRHAATVTLGFDEGRARAWLFAEGLVDAEVQTETGFTLDVFWTDRQSHSFARLRGA
jgi:GTP-binding protein HflX